MLRDVFHWCWSRGQWAPGVSSCGGTAWSWGARATGQGASTTRAGPHSCRAERPAQGAARRGSDEHLCLSPAASYGLRALLSQGCQPHQGCLMTSTNPNHLKKGCLQILSHWGSELFHIRIPRRHSVHTAPDHTGAPSAGFNHRYYRLDGAFCNFRISFVIIK